jgi:TonB family protein
LPEEQGILVDFGNSNKGFGNFEPQMSNPAPAQPQPQTRQETQPEETITQDTEETVALPSKPVEKPAEKPAEKPVEKPKETAKPAEEKPAERTPDPRATFPGRGNAGNATSQGEAGGAGNQGVPSGAPNVHVYGDGIEVGGGLAGRGIEGGMPKPDYNINEQGKVVVSITVDKDGKVIIAVPGAKGSTTSDARLYEAARKAALKTKFVRNPNVVEQTGTITYIFKLTGE